MNTIPRGDALFMVYSPSIQELNRGKSIDCQLIDNIWPRPIKHTSNVVVFCMLYLTSCRKPEFWTQNTLTHLSINYLVVTAGYRKAEFWTQNTWHFTRPYSCWKIKYQALHSVLHQNHDYWFIICHQLLQYHSSL